MAGGSIYYRDIYASGSATQHNGNVYSGNTFNSYPSPEPRGRSAPPAQQAYQSSSGKRQLRKEDYTVGWICALPVPEWRASRLLLDEEHEDIHHGLTTRHQYVYGSMNGHNIVMGCLPRTQTGKGAAASVASEMVSTFPLLRFGLLVGVGGGVPSARHDVRLGDVVVSEPDRERQHGGVVQYDYGKLIQGQGFKLNGVLSQPPEIILSGLGKVQSAPIRKGRFLEYLDLYDEDDYDEFTNDGPLVDRLFPPECVHVEKASDCDTCASKYTEIDRKKRKEPKTRVHYGSIASGDEVLRDAIKRDEIGKEHDVLCFEMEAAGLMNVFPCLVVRGICDYSDSHKNKAWQPFAAAAAASWAKEFLRNVAPMDVGGTDTIGRLVEQPGEQQPSAPRLTPEIQRQTSLRSSKPEYTDRSPSLKKEDEEGEDAVEGLTARFQRLERIVGSLSNRTSAHNYYRGPTVENFDSDEEDSEGRHVTGRDSDPYRAQASQLQTETALSSSTDQQNDNDDDVYASGIVERSRNPYVAHSSQVRTRLDPSSPLQQQKQQENNDPDGVATNRWRDDGKGKRREQDLATPIEFERPTSLPPVSGQSGEARKSHSNESAEPQYAWVRRRPRPTRVAGFDFDDEPKSKTRSRSKSPPDALLAPTAERVSASFMRDSERNARAPRGWPVGAKNIVRSRSESPIEFTDPKEIFEEFMRRGGGESLRRESRKAQDSNQPDGRPPHTSRRPFGEVSKPAPQERILVLSSAALRNGVKKKLAIKQFILEGPTGRSYYLQQVIEVPITPGMKSGSKIKYPDLGDETEDGKRDLHFIVIESPEESFRPRGDDLWYVVMLAENETDRSWRRDIYLATDQKYRTIENKGPTDSRFYRRYPGEGLQTSRGRGDLIVTVKIIPNSIRLRD